MMKTSVGTVSIAALLAVLAQPAEPSEPGPRALTVADLRGNWEGVSTQYPFAASLEITGNGGKMAICAGAFGECHADIYSLSRVSIAQGEVVIAAKAEKFLDWQQVEFRGRGKVFGEWASVQGKAHFRNPKGKTFDIEFSLVRWPDGFGKRIAEYLESARSAMKGEGK